MPPHSHSPCQAARAICVYAAAAATEEVRRRRAECSGRCHQSGLLCTRLAAASDSVVLCQHVVAGRPCRALPPQWWWALLSSLKGDVRNMGWDRMGWGGGMLAVRTQLQGLQQRAHARRPDAPAERCQLTAQVCSLPQRRSLHLVGKGLQQTAAAQQIRGRIPAARLSVCGAAPLLPRRPAPHLAPPPALRHYSFTALRAPACTHAPRVPLRCPPAPLRSPSWAPARSRPPSCRCAGSPCGHAP